jgi:protein-S-isoprenylcysteine O-methyltransferase Ste14
MAIDQNSAKVRFPPPFVYIGFLLIGLVIDRLAGLGGTGASLTLRLWLAAAAIAPGVALVVAAMGGFSKAKTPPEPWREVTALVTGGVYAFTRNPMYLGMAAIYIGLALAADSLGALALMPITIIAIQTQVIAREEAYMAQRFGAAYRDYRSRVRRWL